MSEREPFPDEDAEGAEPAGPSSVPADVPEADAIEQSAPVGGGDGQEEPATVGDRPEADALEQATEVTEPDDEYRG